MQPGYVTHHPTHRGVTVMINLQKALEADSFYPGQIIADGKIHRFKRDQNDKGESAWYVAHQNHSDKGEVFYVAVWGDWHEQGQERKYISSFTQTAGDRKKIEAQLVKAEKARRQEQERVWQESAEKSKIKWDALDPNSPLTAYCTRKKLSSLFGGRSALDPQSNGRAIYIPVSDLDGKIWGLQKILESGEKRFSPGTKKTGNFFVLGSAIKNEEIIYLAEGYATAASIHMALGRPVVCCFDAGNLEPVAKAIRSKFKEASFVICGDDDRFSETGNAGREKAEAAAKAVLGKAVFPIFKSTESRPTDFNDAHCLDGIDSVRLQILGVKPEVSRVIPLGFDEDTYYYITSSNEQIIPVTAAQHVENKFLNMMPVAYWESQFPGQKGPDYKRAASDLMEACRKRGQFKPSHVRGGGVWFEKKQGVVVNMGKSLLVNGKEAPLNSFPSRYIYRMASEIELHEKPLTVEECKSLTDILIMLRWKKPEFAQFLAGWLVVAPICGMLPWRPHLWLLGPPGAGKSWIMEHLIALLFGENKHYFQGNTTEAGIRQDIGSNAMPVIFDEFETDDEKSSQRVQSVLELIRQASSESEGSVTKGSSGGKSMQYRVRFSACVASVRLNLDREQDRTRFTVTELCRPDGDESTQFNRLQDALALLPLDFGARLFARSVSMAPTILENQKRFHNRLAQRYNARFGQQYGTLLAGYAALLSDECLSDVEIDGILDGINLVEESEIIHEKDEGDCAQYLLQKILKNVDSLSLGAKVDRSVSELIRIVIKDDIDAPTLSRYGMKIQDGFLVVAKKHPELSALFSGTKWVTGWSKALSSINGAKKGGVIRSGKNITRSIMLPLSELFL